MREALVLMFSIKVKIIGLELKWSRYEVQKREMGYDL